MYIWIMNIKVHVTAELKQLQHNTDSSQLLYESSRLERSTQTKNQISGVFLEVRKRASLK